MVGTDQHSWGDVVAVRRDILEGGIFWSDIYGSFLDSVLDVFIDDSLRVARDDRSDIS